MSQSRLEKKILKAKIHECSHFPEDHPYCPLIELDSELKCQYKGERMTIPAYKEGVQGMRYVTGCLKPSLYSQRIKRIRTYDFRGC